MSQNEHQNSALFISTKELAQVFTYGNALKYLGLKKRLIFHIPQQDWEE